MWKDFFYFSKGQRIAITVLIALIVVIIVLNLALPLLIGNREKPVDNSFITEAREFELKMVQRDSLRNAAWQHQYQDKYTPANATWKTRQEKYSLFAFDPNKADSATFIALGIKPFIVSNIFKFRKKGGVFKTPESFSKVYGISPEKFNELAPHIRIDQTITTKTKTDSIKYPGNPASAKVQGMVVELNSADTTELLKVTGIGRGYAKGIVRFRQQTGGFASVDQLRELYGMTEANFQKIKSSCTANAGLIRRIKINSATVERLNAHPYINFYQAKAIYELRRQKVKLKNIQELKNLDAISPDELEKITPYLSFE